MERLCNSRTTLYCILGNPVHHCSSPTIHNLAFQKKGINSVFLSFVCDHSNIQEIFQSIRVLNIQGGTITMPAKIESIPFMDSISDDARLIGSINVFKNDNGVLTGFNTDGLGVVHFLQHKQIPFHTKAVLAGAGGAGQSIAIQLALHGAKILAICDTNEAAANSLAHKICQSIPTCQAYAISPTESTIIQELQNSAVLIDATPLGMAPLEDQSLLSSVDGIPKNVIFFDICYAPPKTKLLKLAQSKGFQTYNGLGMLLYQGAEAFRIWTGQEFPLDYVQKQLPLYTSQI